MHYIKRHLEDLVERTGSTFKCVMVTGARQTGKSTLVRRLFPERRYVPIDDPFVEEQANDDPNMFMELNPPPATYDEVQRAPGLFRYIKIACDESDGRGLFCLSGSQPLELMELASESLAGRVGILELGTLSLREIQGVAFNEPFVPTMDYLRARSAQAAAPGSLWELIHRGGYPELQDPGVDWNVYFSSYVKTYLERDVRKLTAVQSLDDFRRFMVAVAARTGQMLNYASIASEIGRDQGTVRKWLSILEATGVVYVIEPFAHSVLKRVIKTPKLYFRDTGLAAYLTRWLTPETLANGAMAGAFFETYVVNEILKSYANRGIDYRYAMSYYRGKDRRKVRRGGAEVELESEIDLILESDGVLYPVEIKLGSKVSQDQAAAFSVLDRIPDKKRGTGAIVCTCPQPAMLAEGVLQIPAWYL